MRRGPVKRGKAVTEDKRQDAWGDPERLVKRLRERQAEYVEHHLAIPHDHDALEAADTIEALRQRVGELEAALRQVSAPFDLGANEYSIGFDTLACEFNRRQWIGAHALREESGERRRLSKTEAQAMDKAHRDGVKVVAKGVLVDPEQSQEGECPHGCKDGWIEVYRPGPGDAKIERCPIHGTAKETE